MYELLEKALVKAGIPANRRIMVDRGDGILVYIEPDVPKTKVLDTVITTLSELLGQLPPERTVRLRAALHAGEVHQDDNGRYGAAVDLTCRLLDAEELKGKLKAVLEPLVFVVSQLIYDSLVRHEYDGIDPKAFEPLVNVEMGDIQERGWVQVPGTGLTA
jgi:hypothetical protein